MYRGNQWVHVVKSKWIFFTVEITTVIFTDTIISLKEHIKINNFYKTERKVYHKRYNGTNITCLVLQVVY